MWYGKEKGNLERTWLWGLTVLHKTWLNIYNKGSFRNLGHLQKLEKHLWLFCSFLVAEVPPSITATQFSSVWSQEGNRCRAPSRGEEVQGSTLPFLPVCSGSFCALGQVWVRVLTVTAPILSRNTHTLLHFANEVISHVSGLVWLPHFTAFIFS